MPGTLKFSLLRVCLNLKRYAGNGLVATCRVFGQFLHLLRKEQGGGVLSGSSRNVPIGH